MTVSVRELKNGLSSYLRRAQAGEEIVVTSHGKPVGRLVGPPAVAPFGEQEALARLRDQAWLRPGNGKTLQSGSPADVEDGTVDELMTWLRER